MSLIQNISIVYAHSFTKNREDQGILSAERNMTPVARAVNLAQILKQIHQNHLLEEEEVSLLDGLEYRIECKLQ